MELKDFIKKMGELKVSEVIGIVLKIDSSPTKNGKPMWKVYVEGEEAPLFAWASSVVKDIVVGEEATFEVDDKGGFLHIVKATQGYETNQAQKASPDKAKPTTSQATPRNFQNNPYLGRAGALNTAVAFFGLDSAPETTSIEEVIAVAMRFAEFVETGK